MKTLPLFATFLAQNSTVRANYHFDRSWYGRVLVERVEGFATKEEWMRAYDEINDFEKLLTDDHYIMGKFFYHISKEEQLKRFKDREKNPLKRWKITDEDWRNREKWDEYVEAMEDMFEKQVSQMRSGILLKVTINCMLV